MAGARCKAKLARLLDNRRATGQKRGRVSEPTKPKKRTRKKKNEAQLEFPAEAGGAGRFDAVAADAGDLDGPMEEQASPEEIAAALAEYRAHQKLVGYWNAIVGLWFVPFAWIFTHAFFETLSRAMSEKSLPFWMRHEFLMFGLGSAIWFLWLGFCLITWHRPRPVYLYVLGHELTHAALAKLFLGRVNRFKATSDGGYIETDRYNFLIALGPYLWPFYSVPVLAMWALSLFFPWMLHYREWFLVGLGFTWMFHLTFTVWMLPKGQTDFKGPGLVFSFTIIYLVNIVLLTGALVSLAPEVSWGAYFRQLMKSGIHFYDAAIDLMLYLWSAFIGLFKGGV